MSIDLKGIIEKLAVAAILALAAHAYSMYRDIQALLSMKDEIQAISRYVARLDPSILEPSASRRGAMEPARGTAGPVREDGGEG
jgi:hypothetical protein